MSTKTTKEKAGLQPGAFQSNLSTDEIVTESVALIESAHYLGETHRAVDFLMALPSDIRVRCMAALDDGLRGMLQFLIERRQIGGKLRAMLRKVDGGVA